MTFPHPLLALLFLLALTAASQASAGGSRYGSYYLAPPVNAKVTDATTDASWCTRLFRSWSDDERHDLKNSVVVDATNIQSVVQAAENVKIAILQKDPILFRRHNGKSDHTGDPVTLKVSADHPNLVYKAFRTEKSQYAMGAFVEAERFDDKTLILHIQEADGEVRTYKTEKSDVVFLQVIP